MRWRVSEQRECESAVSACKRTRAYNTRHQSVHAGTRTRARTHLQAQRRHLPLLVLGKPPLLALPRQAHCKPLFKLRECGHAVVRTRARIATAAATGAITATATTTASAAVATFTATCVAMLFPICATNVLLLLVLLLLVPLPL